MFNGSNKIQLVHTLADIISLDNLLLAWKEFSCGKKSRADVQEFGARLMDNIILLHDDLGNRRYVHGGYHAFNISDPKPRIIHKASVRDRLLHHAIYRVLYPFFDRTFIADSFSCRVEKGTHAALMRFKKMSNQVSRNNTRTCWVLKCDIKKFFASIDQKVLFGILEQYIPDKDVMWLLGQVIKSFRSTAPGVGLPLGNLTSQLLVNIYMNEFDQFAKHQLKAKYYIRYADDFVFLSEDKTWLEELLPQAKGFLEDRLRLTMHPNKIFLKTLASGVDFLGWVHFPTHRVLRGKTKDRLFRRIRISPTRDTLASYAGMLKHGNTYKILIKVEAVSTAA